MNEFPDHILSKYTNIEVPADPPANTPILIDIAPASGESDSERDSDSSSEDEDGNTIRPNHNTSEDIEISRQKRQIRENIINFFSKRRKTSSDNEGDDNTPKNEDVFPKKKSNIMCTIFKTEDDTPEDEDGEI